MSVNTRNRQNNNSDSDCLMLIYVSNNKDLLYYGILLPLL